MWYPAISRWWARSEAIRRVAAHRASDANQHGDTAFHVEAAAHEQYEPKRGTHADEDEPDRFGADPGDRMQVQAQAEEDDPEAQDVLDREPDPGKRPCAGAAEADHRQADEHRERDLEADRERVGERGLRGQVGGKADRACKQETGRQRLDSAPKALVPRPERNPGADRRGVAGQECNPHSTLPVPAQRPSRASPGRVQCVRPIEA
jgi:hypothetical protein